MSATAQKKKPKAPPISVLFVCLGNICRSPMAEAVFKSMTRSHHDSIAQVDSSGTGAYHLDDPPDPRTLQVLQDHGIDEYSHAARKIRGEDLIKFDYILAMDRSNLYDLRTLMKDRAVRKEKEDENEKEAGVDETGMIGQVLLFGDFGGRKGEQVVDPYYGPNDGFAIAYEQMERFSKGFTAQVLEHCESEVK